MKMNMKHETTLTVSPDATVIDFKEAWLDDDGLPTKLHTWLQNSVSANTGKQKTTTFVGTRWHGTTPLPFHIDCHTAFGNFWFVARFTGTGDSRVDVFVAQIDFNRGGRLDRRYIEVKKPDGAEGETVWLMNFRRARQDDLVDLALCPTIQFHALRKIDIMMNRTIAALFPDAVVEDGPGYKPSTLLSMLGPGPTSRDLYRCEPVTPGIEAAYKLMVEYYNSRDEGSSTQSQTAEEFYRSTLDSLRIQVLAVGWKKTDRPQPPTDHAA